MKRWIGLLCLLCVLPVVAQAQNPYYDHGLFPSPGSPATSASMRAELDLIEAGFNKLPTLSGNSNKMVVINSSGTALTSRSLSGGTFPSAPAVNDLFLITTAATDGDCSVLGGALRSLCVWDGADWTPVVAPSSGLTGWPQTRVEEITWANAIGTAACIGSGTNPLCIYEDATLGGVIRPKTLGNVRTYIWSGFNWCLYGIAPDSCMFTVTPGAATSLLKYTYQSGHRPLASVYIGAESMHGDGTNCPSNPTKVDVFNQPRYTFICTENNGSRLKGVIPMRNNWDAGVIFIKPHYMQTAADTGSVNLEVAAACRAFGVAFDGAYGTEIEVDDAALVGSGAIEATLSAAVTPNGTCAAGDLLYFYIDVDATDNPTTAAATLHLLGADVFWSITSPSH